MMAGRRNHKRRGADVMTQSSLLAVPCREQKPLIIDDDHLGRMTLGNRSLEREVLEIFARQTVLTLGRSAAAKPACVAAAAHTLKGSARGIGAWCVAEAAERIEQAVARGDKRAMNVAIAELEAASVEVRAEIGARLGVPIDATAGTLGGRSRDH
jgi:HPt (histidine-containing phosphotransfer) domain-containing protein